MRAADRQGVADLQGPVGYDPTWLLLAVAAVLLMVGYLLAVWWWTRARSGAAPPDRVRRPARAARAEALARLDALEQAVAGGRITPREGHRQLSEVVRAHAAATSGLPATTMTLAELRAEGPPALAEVVALVYPPEFGPGDQPARQRLTEALARARALVAGGEPASGRSTP